jgi:chemotaxis protein MotB
MSTRAHRHIIDEEESYFVSMTDLMVGLLFIFIIMLMVFALQYREAAKKSLEAEREKQMTTERLVNAEQVRDDILESLQKYLQDHGITVQVVKDQGVLRLPEEILFDKALAEINQKGDHAIEVLAQALEFVLPCYARGDHAPLENCPPRRGTIDSIFIEGHTDIDPLAPRAGMKDNIDLSAIRAANTYRTLLLKRGDLLGYKNTRGYPVLSVSGYGQYRPAVVDQSLEENKAKNRRIDLRILMTTPRAEDAARFEREIGEEMRKQ